MSNKAEKVKNEIEEQLKNDHDFDVIEVQLNKVNVNFDDQTFWDFGKELIDNEIATRYELAYDFRSSISGDGWPLVYVKYTLTCLIVDSDVSIPITCEYKIVFHLEENDLGIGNDCNSVYEKYRNKSALRESWPYCHSFITTLIAAMNLPSPHLFPRLPES